MAEQVTDPALKAEADALAPVVAQLSNYNGAAGSPEIRAAQQALGYVSMAYRLLDAASKPPAPAPYYDPYW